jgi:hypothetical protein
MRFEPHANATDAGEQINERERRIVVLWRIFERKQPLPDGIGEIWRRIGFAHFPTPQRAYINAELLRYLALTVATTQTGEEMPRVLHGNLLREIVRTLCPLCVPIARLPGKAGQGGQVE